MRLRSVRYAAVALALAPAAAPAQEINARVGKLESEMRAVQRKVFPGGAGQYVEPDISAAPIDRAAPGAPASSAVTDLTQRVSSLEDQVRDLTGQVEQNGHRLRQLEDDFAAYRRATDARLAAPSPASGDAPGGAGNATSRSRDDDAPRASTATDRAVPRGSGDGPSSPDRASAPPSRDPARADKIAAVERPSTGDAAEDSYMYGYRLWAAKLYPEAETQLKKVVADYPASKRASYAQNLLGRSYLDDGKPSLASIAFYDNYKKMPDGERAPDSLLYLGQALMKLNKPADACKVYGELNDVYGTRMSAEMKANVAKGRGAAKCK
jgi:TolA-binding protein